MSLLLGNTLKYLAVNGIMSVIYSQMGQKEKIDKSNIKC